MAGLFCSFVRFEPNVQLCCHDANVCLSTGEAAIREPTPVFFAHYVISWDEQPVFERQAYRSQGAWFHHLKDRFEVSDPCRRLEGCLSR